MASDENNGNHTSGVAGGMKAVYLGVSECKEARKLLVGHSASGHPSVCVGSIL